VERGSLHHDWRLFAEFQGSFVGVGQVWGMGHDPLELEEERQPLPRLERPLEPLLGRSPAWPAFD
jgi:hypothetical protein